MRKGTMKVLGIAAVSALGISGWKMYKKKHPNAVGDIKKAAKNFAHNAAKKLEDMD